MRRYLFFVLASCADSATPATGAAIAAAAPLDAAVEWKDILTGVSVRGDVFADVRGIWRCEDGVCEHRPWREGAVSRRALPCNASGAADYAFSQAGTHVAQVCEGALAITSLGTGEVVRRALPFPELDGLEVDESGVVTAIHDHSVARVTSQGVLGPFALEVPGDAISPADSAELHPANGPWIAYTHGAFAREVAWRASTPSPTAVALGGGALFNGDQMWVSLMTSGYVRMTESGPVAVAGRVGGGLAGHGILVGVVPWGPDGLIVQYEDAALLVDRELITRRQIQTPNAKGTIGTIGGDPSGAWLFFVHEDGRISAAAL